jgi:hypothetical protein
VNLSGTQPNAVAKYLVPLALVLLVAGVGIGYGLNTFLSERRMADVAARGADVMPFDLDQTTHTFERAADGGVQAVTANDPADTEQIALIRAHLQDEAAKFARGDFSDPAQIHGEDMPGLADLRAGADRITVAYRELPDGARLTYRTDDQAMIHALHTWFDAQLADHGEHAQPGMQH